MLSDFDMAGNGLHRVGLGIQPEGMPSAFPFEPASVCLQMPQQIPALH
jgi:hypothetical protein